MNSPTPTAEEIYSAAAAAGMRPDPLLTISQWADKYRTLSQRAAAEPGPWRTDRTPYLRAEPVATRRIPEKLREKRQHFLDHGWIELRGRVVIEINDLLAGDHGKGGA